MVDSRQQHTRLRGAVIAGCFLLVAAALSRPSFPIGTASDRVAGSSIYPWWTGVLVVAGGLAGLVVLLAPRASRLARAAASSVVVVVGAQVAGTGVVAAKHWHPASNMGGYVSSKRVDMMEQLAMVIAVAGTAAVVLALWQLITDGAFTSETPRGFRRLCVTAGVLVVVVLPFALMVGDEYPDITTWGAMGLIYAGPWGVSILLAAHLSRTASRTLLVTVAGSALMASAGPQMAGLVTSPVLAQFAALTLLPARPGGHLGASRGGRHLADRSLALFPGIGRPATLSDDRVDPPR